MKLLRFICFVAISFALSRNVSGQSFINLNFEQSVVVSSNLNQFGFYYGTANVPGWTGYLGTNQATTISWNNPTLGNANIGVESLSAMQGQFTLVLQPGANPFGNSSEKVSASISQSGLVPAFAQSLQLLASINSGVSVSLGGQTLSLIPMGTGANYTIYGANISQFAGQIETLTITALAAPLAIGNNFDSISFSPSPVPEPSALSLFCVCILFICWRMKWLCTASNLN